MIIGCPKEIKVKEFRVGLVPGGVKSLVQDGHTVLVERSAGLGAGILDSEYQEAGATLTTVKDVWAKSNIIIKVKEPIASEYSNLREEQILYTYLHLAAAPELTKALVDQRVTSIGYETVQTENGHLPLLRPMSEIAGRIAPQIGAYYLQKYAGGKGVLLGGATGVSQAHVAVLGGGVAGTNAAKMALGLGADVTVLDVNLDRLEYLDHIFGNKVRTLYSNPTNLKKMVARSDLLIGAVLIPGAKAPNLVSESEIKTMEAGSVVVDISIDQGGCIETIRPTSHEEPVYDVHGVLHYGVTNMPGAVARTSTYALTNVTFHYLRKLATLGFEKALKDDSALRLGLNTHKGDVTCEPVAKALGY
jgi:alanine dehydrogenase